MGLARIRGGLYRAAKILGDVQAVDQAAKAGNTRPIERRLVRRIAGKAAGRILGAIFK